MKTAFAFHILLCVFLHWAATLTMHVKRLMAKSVGHKSQREAPIRRKTVFAFHILLCVFLHWAATSSMHVKKLMAKSVVPTIKIL